MLLYLKLLLTAIFWGGTYIAGRLIVDSVHPLSASFLRFFIATLFLVIITIRLEGRLPRLHKAQIVPVVLSGLTGVCAYNILFLTGLWHITAGRASLIIATTPVLISLFSAFLFKEQLTAVKLIGIGLSVMGAMVVVSNGHWVDVASYDIGLGEILIFGSVLSWVGYSLIGKVIMASLSPLASVTYSAIVGTALLALPAWYAGIAYDIGHYAAGDWMSLFYLGFFGTVLSFFWYYEGIQRIGTMKTSVFINFVPVSAILLSIVLLDEPLTISLLFGGTLVIMGAYATNASKQLTQFCQRALTAMRSAKG